MKIFLFLMFIAPGMSEPIIRQAEVESVAQCFAMARQAQEDWQQKEHNGPYKLSIGCSIEGAAS